MASYVNKYNQHILLEPQSNEKNSFIANLNTIAENIDTVETFNTLYDKDTVSALNDLSDLDLAKSIKYLGEDLKKGAYRGARKLDIDLLKNYKLYESDFTEAELAKLDTSNLQYTDLTGEEQNAVWKDTSRRIFYGSCTIYINTNSLSQTFTFTQPVSDPDSIKDELQRIFDDDANKPYIKVVDSDGNYVLDNEGNYTYKLDTTATEDDETGETKFYITRTKVTMSPLDSTYTFNGNRNIVRIYDTYVRDITKKGSNVASIELHKASEAQYKELAYGSEVYEGSSNSDSVEFAFSDTTSSLYVLASNAADILEAGTYIENTGADLQDTLQTIESNVKTIKASIEKTNSDSLSLLNNTNNKLKLIEGLQNINVETNVVDSESDPKVAYTASSNKLTFDLPRSSIALFSADSMYVGNDGHLYFDPLEYDTTKQTVDVSINNDTGVATITITPKK